MVLEHQEVGDTIERYDIENTGYQMQAILLNLSLPPLNLVRG